MLAKICQAFEHFPMPLLGLVNVCLLVIRDKHTGRLQAIFANDLIFELEGSIFKLRGATLLVTTQGDKAIMIHRDFDHCIHLGSQRTMAAISCASLIAMVDNDNAGVKGTLD